MTLIDRDPLIVEYDKALNWLQEHIDEMSCEEYSMQFAAVMMAKTVLMNAPVIERSELDG